MGKTTLRGNTHTAPGLRPYSPIYRIETLWCYQCDKEIAMDEGVAQVNAMSGGHDIHGPFHVDCARKVRDALNGK